MKTKSEESRRKSMRLKGYDYRRSGYYFVTICTQKRQCLFGDASHDKMKNNSAGNMIAQAWQEIDGAYDGIGIDEYVVMPNHLHGIIILSHHTESAVERKPPLSLSGIVHRYKSWTTRLFADGVKKTLWPRFDNRLWQRSFYEHVIRNEAELDKIRQYILDNPRKWAEDPEYPVSADNANDECRGGPQWPPIFRAEE